MDKAIFKKYDIRGIFGEQFNEKDALNIIHFLLNYFKPKSVLLSRDTRASSQIMHQYIIKNLKYDREVYDLGVMPTSIVYYYVHTHNIDFAVIFTASHNPKEYGGLKILIKGEPLNTNLLIEHYEKIEGFVAQSDEKPNIKVISSHEVIGKYVSFINQYLPDIEPNQKVCFDCSNGSFSKPIITQISNHFFNAEFICCNPSQNFECHDPDPSKPKNLEKLKNHCKTALGVGFDGDGDRVAFTYKYYYLGAEFVVLMIIDKLAKTLKAAKKIVVDSMFSEFVIDELKSKGYEVVVSKTGRVNIYKKMQEHNAFFGAEKSGHYYFALNNKIYEDLILVVGYVYSSLGQFDDILKFMQGIEEYEHNFKDEGIDLNTILERFPLEYLAIDKKDGLKIIGKGYWLIVRKSNTEPLVRVRAQAKSKEVIDKIIDYLNYIFVKD